MAANILAAGEVNRGNNPPVLPDDIGAAEVEDFHSIWGDVMDEVEKSAPQTPCAPAFSQPVDCFMEVGQLIYVRFEGEALWCERLLLARAPVKGGKCWMILTPDGDIYVDNYADVAGVKVPAAGKESGMLALLGAIAFVETSIAVRCSRKPKQD